MAEGQLSSGIVTLVPGSTLTRCAGAAVLVSLAGVLELGCTSVDPGPDFTVPTFVFDENFFYCHVEPQYIFGGAYQCGKGNGSDPANGCHFNPSAVSGMALQDHPLVNCGGGDAPVNPGDVAEGTPARSNYEAVSLEMSIDYTSAPCYVRPSGSNHPRQIFNPSTDMTVGPLLAKWAALSQ
jgi:hypothetical protein